MSTFYSVVATLFLKNLVSLDHHGSTFFLCIFCLPSDVLPFAILLFYSLEKGLAKWLSSLPAKLHPVLLFGSSPLFCYFDVLGKVHYSEDFLHEPARLPALVSGACIIFLCFRICIFCLFYLQYRGHFNSVGAGRG